MNTHLGLMEPYIRQCIKNQASYWLSNRYLLTRIFKTSSKRSVSCNSVIGEYDPHLCWHGKFLCTLAPSLHTLHYIYTIYTHSQYVVKYYGSYFKNTDLWIVMEYCGAGSVSDIMRIINRPVSCHLFEYLKIIQLHFVTRSMYICSTAQRGGDCDSVTVCSKGAGVSSF